MAHFAELNESGLVISIAVIDNSRIEVNGVESETKGISIMEALSGHRRWKQTSYIGAFRNQFAGIGYVYDSVRDAFISPMPYKSWTLNETTCRWEPPTRRPDGFEWRWNENEKSWYK